MPDSNYNEWKDKTVSELATLVLPPTAPEMAERHTIYALALMAITHHYWNGNRYGRGVRYPLNTPVTDPASIAAGDYLGHNIAALAVDADGAIIDFEFNHNEVFNSSVEHAESRLLRRLFSLTQIQDSWSTKATTTKSSYGTVLSDVTLYTTLESCAQCSGIMALANLARVVFLQTDPGQYAIGNMMRNMTAGTGLAAPEPIPASSFGFTPHAKLDAAYQAFRDRPADAANAMVTKENGDLISGKSGTTSITSFLCTRAAQEVYAEAAAASAAFDVQFPDFQPNGRGRTNAEAQAEARNFVDYATKKARRGTPHRA